MELDEVFAVTSIASLVKSQVKLGQFISKVTGAVIVRYSSG